MTKKKNEKKIAAANEKNEMVAIFKITYHRYRHWVRSILIEGKVKKFSFKKDKVGYTGLLLVEKTEVDKAEKVLADYKTKKPDTVEMWW